ncbi:MAG TPA: LapA family protein [Rhodocyclaceae bacterium]|nr:LapA family protein [Rhodocyclaceae bacterium]
MCLLICPQLYAQKAVNDRLLFCPAVLDNPPMRIIVWFLRLSAFVLLLGFAIKNDALVTVNFFLGTHWQLPLVLVLLLMFAAGAVVGVTAVLSTLVSQRREIGRLRKLRGEPVVVKSAQPQYPDSV